MNHADVASLIEPEAASPAPAASELLAGARYAAPLPTGARLQEFEISTVIGQGGFGIVYLARDLSLQRSVAIKEYFPTHLAGRDVEGKVRALTPGQAEVLELGRRSFINEARMLARFKHTGLVEVLRFWEQNGTAYMAMPFYDGATLTQYLKRHPGVATEAWLRKTLKPLVEALGHMHQEDCFHRDVAPDNILILKDGSAVLLDLGAARRVIANDAQAMTVMLKPGYAPIEQYSDDPRFRQGPWTDIYAMAAVLFFAVTGKPPPASASRVMRDSVSPLSSVRPEGFSDSFLLAIDRGLSLQPEDRPRSIAEFGALLFAAPTANEPAGALKFSRRSVAGAATADAGTDSATSRTTAAAEPGGSCATSSGSDSPEADGILEGGETADAAVLPRRSLAGRTVAIAAGAAALALSLVAGLLSGTPGDESGDVAAPTAVAPAAPALAASTAASTPETAQVATTVPGALPPQANDPPAPAPADTTGTAEPAAAPEQSSDAATAAPTAAAPTAAAPIPADSGRPAAAPRPAAAAAASAPAPSSKADNGSKPAATGSGTITLSIKPWAEIRVDGVLKGVSPPLKQLTLPAGRHTIEMRNPAAAAPVKQLVEIRPNQKAVLSHQF